MKSNKPKIFSLVLYIVGIAIIILYFSGKLPALALFAAVLSISFGSLLTGMAVNKELNDSIAERRKKREERRRNHRDDRRI